MCKTSLISLPRDITPRKNRVTLSRMTVPRRPAIDPNNMRTGINGDIVPLRDAQLENYQEIDFWEEGNPRAVINMAPDAVRDRIRKLPLHLLERSQMSLKTTGNGHWIIEKLRQNFWNEYFLSLDNNADKMRPAAIYTNACGQSEFYEIISVPERLAYMMRPPESYMYKMNTLLEAGLERFNEILHLPLMNDKGKVDTKLIAEMVKIVAIVDNRVRGAITQRVKIESTSKQLNVNMNMQQEYPKSHQEIEQELKQIELEIKRIDNPKADMSQLELFGEKNVEPAYTEIKATAIKA